MEYCELYRIGEVNDSAKEGWRLAFVTRNSYGGPLFIMERSVNAPSCMTLAPNTPEAWKRYYEGSTLSPQ